MELGRFCEAANLETLTLKLGANQIRDTGATALSRLRTAPRIKKTPQTRNPVGTQKYDFWLLYLDMRKNRLTRGNRGLLPEIDKTSEGPSLSRRYFLVYMGLLYHHQGIDSRQWHSKSSPSGNGELQSPGIDAGVVGCRRD